MSNIPSISIQIKHGVHHRGEPYPEHDFTYAIEHSLSGKGVVATSNLEIKDQINMAYIKTPNASEVVYFYYAEDEK